MNATNSKTKLYVALAAVGLIALCLVAWAPWISKSYAEKKALEHYASHEGKVKKCSLDCPTCGINQTSKIPFGYEVDINFRCESTGRPRKTHKTINFLGYAVES